MPQVELVKMTRGVRGKGNQGRKVEFEGISDTAPRPDNVIDAAMQFVNQDLQAFWDRFVLGANEYAYEAVADPIAAFIDSSWDSDKVKSFRASVHAIAKFTGKDKEDVAEELVKSLG